MSEIFPSLSRRNSNRLCCHICSAQKCVKRNLSVFCSSKIEENWEKLFFLGGTKEKILPVNFKQHCLSQYLWAALPISSRGKTIAKEKEIKNKNFSFNLGFLLSVAWKKENYEDFLVWGNLLHFPFICQRAREGAGTI